MADQNDPAGQTPADNQPPQDAAVSAANAAQPASEAAGPSVTITSEKGDVSQTQVANEIKNVTNNYTHPQLEALLNSAGHLIDASGSLINNFTHRPDSSAPLMPPPENMPVTEQEISDWFCQSLTLAQRCQVRATAILHGAPAHLVSKAAMELFSSFIHPNKDNAKDQQSPNVTESDMSSIILERSFVTIRRSGNANRLYWKDADSEGYSPFGLRVLKLLAGEIQGTAGIRNENSLSMIEKWVATGISEMAQRSAYALGAIWWDIDGKRLTDVTREWAESSRAAERLNAPLLAFGAYASEWSSRTDEAETPKTPTKLATQRMLDDLGHLALRDVNRTALASVVSSAYGLIGLEWTEQALDGLDYILGLDSSRSDDAPDVVPVQTCLPAMVAYSQLAAAGLFRPALARLGIRARLLVRRPSTPVRTEEERRRERRRKDRLFNAQLAFFFIVSISQPSTSRKWGRYGEQSRAEEKPRFNQNNDGRDVLLDAILSEEEEHLRFDVQSLLWSSMASETYEWAFETLRRWAEVIATAGQQPESASMIRGKAFFVSLGSRIQAWDAAAEFTGSTTAMERYHRALLRWASLGASETNKALSVFAQRILQELSSLG